MNQCPQCGFTFGDEHDYNVLPPKPTTQKVFADRTTIAEAHQWYQMATRGEESGPSWLTMQSERLWFDFFREGHTMDELRKVFCFIRSQIKQQKRRIDSLKLSNLLDLQRFSEDLAMVALDLSAKVPPAPGAKENGINVPFTQKFMATFTEPTAEEKAASERAIAGLREARKAL